MSTTIKLRKPIQFGEETIEELTFRPLLGKDLRKLQMSKGGEMDMVLTLAGRLSGQNNVVIDKLEGEDLMEVLSTVANFMPAGPTTGDES